MTHPKNTGAIDQGPEEIAVVIGSGAIAQAIVRRIGIDKTILLADINNAAAKAAATALADVGFRTQPAHVDVPSGESRAALAAEADALGTVVNVVHTAGLSPAQATRKSIVAVDLVGTAYVLEEFGRIIGRGGSGVVISSQAGHMLPALPQEQKEALSRTPASAVSKRANNLARPSGQCRVGRPRGTAELAQPRHHHDPASPRRAERTKR